MSASALLVFQLIVLLFSVMVHEIAHGAVALRFGDETAKREGRLTLNPLKHIDPFGSVILPLMLLTLSSLSGGGIVLGWAKPVPYNPFFLKNPKRDAGFIAAAGPLTNLVLAAVFGIAVRILLSVGYAFEPLYLLMNIVILTNVSLAVFNLLPLPPLDGSGILFSFLPESARGVRDFLMRYGTLLLLAFIFFGFSIISPIIVGLYHFIAGPAAIM